MTMYFKDRNQAGQMLAGKLKKYKGQAGIVLAVPRGGVPVAYEVAKVLELPLEIILTKKIGHPMNKEYAIGAASLTEYFVIPHEQVTDEYIFHEVGKIQRKLKEMYEKFMGDKTPEPLAGKTVIVIDDGIATGNTLLGTVHVLKRSNPGKIVIAVPVASQQAVEKLSREVDEVVTILSPEEFYGVGSFYDNFSQVSDEEVLYYLEKWKNLFESGVVNREA